MNVDFFTSYNNDDRHYMTTKFFMSTRFFKDQLEKLLETTRPDCLIADLFFPLAIEATENFNVPRLMFHCTGNYSLCSKYCIRIADRGEEREMEKFMIAVKEFDVKSSSIIVNRFYELEPDYANFTRLL
ncbi:unnamed protein product [Arabidopsis halleri]